MTQRWERGSGQVQGRDIEPKERPQRRRPPQLGHVRPSHLRTALRIVILAGAWSLVLLSFLGTFYALLGRPAAVGNIAQIWSDVQLHWALLMGAVALQLLLSLIQWGGRQQARDDSRWWLMYLAALALSAWLNWEAYGDPLLAMGTPWLWAAVIVIAGDVAPEWILVRRE